MEQIFTTAMNRAWIVRDYNAIDLQKDFYELSNKELEELKKFKKIFNFNGRNYLGRTELKQFYYHLQKGYRNLPF